MMALHKIARIKSGRNKEDSYIDPASIRPPAPVCSVYADAGRMEVGYNRDINLAFQQLQNAIVAQGGVMKV